MVKCKRSAPKALTDKGRPPKGQNEHLKNGPKRYVYHWKSEIWLRIWQSGFTFLLINVTFGPFLRCSSCHFVQSPFVSQCLWGWLFALYHFRNPEKWQNKSRCQKWPKTLRLSVKKWIVVVSLTTGIDLLLINVAFYTISRSRFCHFGG